MNALKRIKRKIWKNFFKNGRLTYSQSGEDVILETILGNIKQGFYVDIGANNPYVQSNTYYFYKKGWRGMNVDALPDISLKFNKLRPRDINIEAGISNNEGELNYYMFESSFYNTFNPRIAQEIAKHTNLTGKIPIKTIPLIKLFKDYNIGNIDFLSVDAEGMDLSVLQSNDWTLYRPKIIITEFFSKGLEKIFQDPIFQYLTSKGYIFFCNSATNAFYLEQSFFSTRFSNNND